MIRTLLAALLLSILAVPHARALGDETGPPPSAGTGCAACEGKGWLPCSHAWESLKGTGDPGPNELDVGVLKVGTFLCTECSLLPCCQGLGWKPCPKCATEEIKARRESQLKASREVMDRRRKDVDSRVKCSPMHLQTQHFELTWDLKGDQVLVYVDAKERTYRDGFNESEVPRLKVNKRRTRIGAHLRAHLYARRLEECWEQFSRTFDPDGKNPIWPTLESDAFEAYVPNRGEKAQMGDSKVEWTKLPAGTEVREWIFVFGAKVPGSVQGLNGPEKFMDRKSLRPVGGAFYFCFLGGEGDSKNFQTDESFHQYLYHNTAEILAHDFAISCPEYRAKASHRKTGRTPALDFPDWMHEAWARVQEMDRFGSAVTSCHHEVLNVDFRSGKRAQYVDQLQKYLAAGKLVPFSEISRLILDKFNAKVHMQIWYMMDYLRRRDPAKFPILITRAKCLACEFNDDKEGFTRVLEEVYNLTPVGFEEAWQADLAKAKVE